MPSNIVPTEPWALEEVAAKQGPTQSTPGQAAPTLPLQPLPNKAQAKSRQHVVTDPSASN